MAFDEQRAAAMAQLLRRDVLTMIHQAGDGHPGPSLSCADIMAVLYSGVLDLDPGNPSWEQRDRFILSKGHACPVLYAALARRGYFPPSELPTLRHLGSRLQGHPDMRKTPGVDSTSGSLGHGVSIGAGMALAARYRKQNHRVFVLTGDGELEEGIIWEAAMGAAKYELGQLVVLVDHNGLQSGGSVDAVSRLRPLDDKWLSFGWHVQNVDGHDCGAIAAAIERACAVPNQPSVIIAAAIKGAGVPFMEGDNSWHKRVPTADELRQALLALGGDPEHGFAD